VARAAIDIGSNSVLLTIVDDEGVVLHDEARVVGLGQGLGDRGLFQPDRLKAAESALTDFAQTAQKLGVEPWAIEAVATSAARRAMNAQTWFSRMQRRIGLRVRVISGEEEARLTWRGALTQLRLPRGPVLVVDLGGGSTELVLGDADRVVDRVSLEIGSVRLTERFLGAPLQVADPLRMVDLRHFVQAEIASFPLEPLPRTVVGVAGTVTTLAAMTQGLRQWDATRVHGALLTSTNLAQLVDLLLPASPQQRRELAAVSPDRADYLLAGAVVLLQVLAAARRPKLLVSDRGLRFGLLAR